MTTQVPDPARTVRGCRRIARLWALSSAAAEELAVLAGLSPTYYSRVEQGRQANVSAEVLDALARALRLDETERTHRHDLAAPARRHKAAVGEARERIANWEVFAQNTIAGMRRQAGQRPHDRRLRSGIDEILAADPHDGRGTRAGCPWRAEVRYRATRSPGRLRGRRGEGDVAVSSPSAQFPVGVLPRLAEGARWPRLG
jgi:transcriptional regulator with XRE-family HTH domain